MFVVAYFIFLICLCVFATVLTVHVLHLYLRAETHPVTPMSPWVCRHCRNYFCTKKAMADNNCCSRKPSNTQLKKFRSITFSL